MIMEDQDSHDRLPVRWRLQLESESLRAGQPLGCFPSAAKGLVTQGWGLWEASGGSPGVPMILKYRARGGHGSTSRKEEEPLSETSAKWTTPTQRVGLLILLTPTSSSSGNTPADRHSQRTTLLGPSVGLNPVKLAFNTDKHAQGVS